MVNATNPVTSATSSTASTAPGTQPNTTVTSINNNATIAQQAFVRTCLTVVEEHRSSNISLAQATIQVFGILPSDTFGTEAFGTYVEQLAQTEHEHATAAVRGAATTVPPTHMTSFGNTPACLPETPTKLP